MTSLRDLLEIQADDGPIDSYRLLGLSGVESDVELIRYAITSTRERLVPHRRGPYADECRELLNLVAQAEVILTDPARKRAYDDGLKARVASTADPSRGDADDEGEDEDEDETPAARPARPVATRTQRLARGESAPTRQRGRWAIALACLATTLLLNGRHLLGPSRFPKPRGILPKAERPENPDLMMPRLPSAPERPTLPDFKLGEPRLVPGLGEISSAYSPSLSTDLNVITFAVAGGTTNYDLWTATRKTSRERFANASPLPACNTAGNEYAPALSPDGLDLVFYRCAIDAEPAGRLFATRRASTTAEFAPPAPVAVPGLPEGKVRQDHAQFVEEGRRLVVRLIKIDGNDPEKEQYLIAKRTAEGEGFEAAVPLPLQSAWPTTVLSADGLRAYQALPEGVKVSCRRELEGAFGPLGPVSTLLTSKIGPIDGPFWIAPKEDVLFYCSPGVGKTLGEERKLWMVRFR